MPIVNMSQDILLAAVNRGSKTPLDVEELRRTITNIGTEVEEIAVMRQFACGRCGRVIERTSQQGIPVECPQCHTDFRTDPQACSPRGENRVIRLNMLAARPDLYDPGGMARCIRGYLGIQPGLIEYALLAGPIRVTVDPRLSEESSFRPCISCAVLRNVALDDEHIKILMNLQENLHWALGRDRKLASIGAYDLDRVQGTEFRYDAVGPDELRFVPLGFDPRLAESALTPREILERHGTGRKYARLLAGFARYPLLHDGQGTVLSMPPIINSEATRVTHSTRNIFVDVTGPSQRVVDRALNVLVTGLRELLPKIQIESVAILRSDVGSGPHPRAADVESSGPRPRTAVVRNTPDLAPGRMELSVHEAAETIGVSLDEPQVSQLLERMGHRVAPRAQPGFGGHASNGNGPMLDVESPAWRNDIMHPVDLIEDAAVAYGFDNLPSELVPTFTVGRPRAIEEQSALARRALAGLGFHQVMTLALTSEDAAFKRLCMDRDEQRLTDLLKRVVRIENPISVEQTICRVSLLAGLMETFSINKQHDLPQNLFEVGDCSFAEPQAETGADEVRFIAAAMIGTHVGYAEIRAVCDAFLAEFGWSGSNAATVAPVMHPTFIAGRAARVSLPNGEELGILGEIHPQVLENYGLRHPAAAMELKLDGLG